MRSGDGLCSNTKKVCIYLYIYVCMSIVSYKKSLAYLNAFIHLLKMSYCGIELWLWLWFSPFKGQWKRTKSFGLLIGGLLTEIKEMK